MDVICQNCEKRPATGRWHGISDPVSIARNPQLAEDWCEQCMIEAQLEYARERAKAIPDLEHRLAELSLPDPQAPSAEGE